MYRFFKNRVATLYFILIFQPSIILFAGRTEYNLMMFDTRTENRKWNITFYDYTTNMADRDILQVGFHGKAAL